MDSTNTALSFGINDVFLPIPVSQEVIIKLIFQEIGILYKTMLKSTKQSLKVDQRRHRKPQVATKQLWNKTITENCLNKFELCIY